MAENTVAVNVILNTVITKNKTAQREITTDNLPYEKVGKNEPVCIADEVPFDIPDSWEWVRFSSVIELQSGQDMTPDKYNSTQHGIPYLTGASNIENEKIIINRWTEYGKAFAYKGDLLITCKGTVGTMAVLEENQVHIARQIMAIRSNKLIKIEYIQLVLETLVTSLKAAAKSMIPGISREDILSSLLPLPPYNEQCKIIEFFRSINSFIDEYSKKELLLQDLNSVFPELLKKSILQEAVQGKLVPQNENDEPASVLLERIRAEKQTLIKAGKIKKDKNESVIFRRDNSHYEKRGAEVVCIDDKIPFEIPDSWEWVRFDSATIYTTDYVANGSFASLRENVKSYKTPNYAIMVKTQDFANNFTRDLTYTDEAGFNFLKKSELFGGELMLSNIGASIGKVFIIPKMDKPMTLAPNSIVVKCIDNVTTRYLQYLMLSFYGQEMLKGFTAGTAMPKFSKTQLRNSLIPLPPHKLQERIVAKLDELFLKVDAL